jgi:hypothetical protein
VWCEQPSNCQLECTQHGGLTCKLTAGGRGDRRGRSTRRDVPPVDVWCVPGAPCHHPGRYQDGVLGGLARQARGEQGLRLVSR